jgi:hypothetical protein
VIVKDNIVEGMIDPGFCTDSATPAPCCDARSEVAVSAITVGSDARVTTSVAHGFSDDDVVAFEDIVGMTEIENLAGVVSVVDTTNFDTGINSTGFTAFTSGNVSLSGCDGEGTIALVDGLANFVNDQSTAEDAKWKITGNDFRYADETGIASGGIIRDNTIRSFGIDSDQSSRYGIRIASSDDNSKVIANDVRTGGNGCITMDSPDHVTVSNNYTEDCGTTSHIRDFGDPTNTLVVDNRSNETASTAVITSMCQAEVLTSVTLENPGVVTTPTHGYSVSDNVCFGGSDMHELNGRCFTIGGTTHTTTTFDIGVDTTGYSQAATTGIAAVDCIIDGNTRS